MPRFKVQVTFHPSPKDYTVEVEAGDYREAENKAVKREMFNSQLPDYPLDSGDGSFEIEAEQLTYECDECGKDFTREQIEDGTEWCKPCAAQIKLEEEAEEQERRRAALAYPRGAGEAS